LSLIGTRGPAVVLILASGGLIVGACGGRQPASRASASRAASTANQLNIGPADGPTELLRVRGMGRFLVRCPRGRLVVEFRMTGGSTIDATVSAGGRARSAFLNTGHSLRTRTRHRSLLQRWQLSFGDEAGMTVASVSIGVSRATGVGNPGCEASGQATVTRRARTNKAPTA
jgi:hypothetical protein